MLGVTGHLQDDGALAVVQGAEAASRVQKARHYADMSAGETSVPLATKIKLVGL